MVGGDCGKVSADAVGSVKGVRRWRTLGLSRRRLVQGAVVVEGPRGRWRLTRLGRGTFAHGHQLAGRTDESKSSNQERTWLRKFTGWDEKTTARSLGTKVASPDRLRQREYGHTTFKTRDCALHSLHSEKDQTSGLLAPLFTFFRHTLTAELATDRQR